MRFCRLHWTRSRVTPGEQNVEGQNRQNAPGAHNFPGHAYIEFCNTHVSARRGWPWFQT
jgi:hypothetical protein